MIDDRALTIDRRLGASRVVPIAAGVPDDPMIAIHARSVAIDPVDRSTQPSARFVAPWPGSDAAVHGVDSRLGASS